jgi:hypothetical protein
MKLLLAIVILIAIAIIGSRFTFYRRRLPIGFRLILLTGTEYIFIGVLLGKMGLNVLDAHSLSQLEPVLLFGLGWIGFLFGVQFEFRELKNLPKFYFSITAIQAIITFFAVFIPMFFLIRFFVPDNMPLVFSAAITLGSAACCTAQSALAIVSKTHKFENRELAGLLRYISGVDGLWGLILFTYALCVIPGIGNTGFNWLFSLKWLLASIGMGVVPALILIALSKQKFTQDEFLLFIIGTILFSAGLSYTIHHSPLVSCLVCGLITANFCRHRTRALTTVIKSEKSIYIFLLLLLGASWSFHLDYSLILMAAYFIFRLIGKVAGSYAATNIYKPRYAVPFFTGLGLIPEGGLAVAIIINFKLLPYSTIADTMITIIVLSVLISEFIGPGLILKLLKEKEK